MSQQSKNVMAKVLEYEQAAKKASAWLLSRLDAQNLLPTEPCPQACFKGIWAFQCTGQVRAAHRLLDAVRDTMMTGPGEFYAKGVDHLGWRSYGNSLVLIAAARLGRYDIASQEAANRLCEYQHACGGFLSTLEPGDHIINLVMPAACGWACLGMGRLEPAIRAADFLVKVHQLQPDLSKFFYARYDTQAGELVTDIPPNQRRNYVIDTEKNVQNFYFPGITAGYLADLYIITGKSEYLDAACSFMDFDLRTPAESLGWVSKCKVAWGAGLVYRASRDRKYLDQAVRIADQVWMANLNAQGYWDTAKIPTNDDASEIYTMVAEHLASEFIFEMMEVVAALSSVNS